MTKYAALIACMLILVGCATDQPPSPSPRSFVPIPAELRRKCEYPTLPPKKDYVAATPDEREAMLFKALDQGNLNTSKCNIRIHAISIWSDNQQKVFEKK